MLIMHIKLQKYACMNICNYSCEILIIVPDKEEVDILLSRGKSLGVSNLRFMPKKASSLRPITNLGSAASLSQAHFRLSGLGQQELKPVNAQLMDLFSILKFEKVFQLGKNFLR